jgi:glycolate oxidase FAD binding subunit
VYFAGASTKAAWGGAAAPADLTVSTAGLTELISHRPGDMTAAVGAGLSLKALQATLAEHGQWLAIDPASEAAGCTIGGLLATGEAGPRRLRYGTMRDLAIGATVVLADGTIAHSGSHVIKNVAGYDLT